MADGDGMVKVESLVQEFLSAQSLKVLPQGPFGEAINQFVFKDDKHAMELFVSEHLTGQVKQLLGLESDDEDLNSAMDIYRSRIEQQVASGPQGQRGERRRVLRPRPETWDSDFDGNWEDEADAWAYEEPTQGAVNSATVVQQSSQGARRGGARQPNDEEMVDADGDDAPASRATTQTRTGRAKTTRATVKKPATKKPPARSATGPGHNAVESEEEDVVMETDEEPPAPKPGTRSRAAKATAAAPTSRKQAPTAAATTRSSARIRQTTLDFSQGAVTQAQPLEVSDDEISDDDDAFEPAPAATRTRRR